MRAEEFTGSSSGRLVRNLDGNLAFIPHPLPPPLEWTNALVSVVSEAEAALGRLSGLGDKFPRPQRLVRLFLRREAELSSRIENTYAGVRTQLLFKSVPEVLGKSPDVIEVDNNFRAIEFGLKAIKNRPLSVGLIKEMHQILLRGTTGEESKPGEFRRVQAHIGSSRDIRAARFVPAPPHAITDCMDALATYMAEDTTIPRVARLALIHYQFEAIHPFEDGNGRIGRVLILLLMSKFGMLPLPLFNPSAYLEQNRRAYYDHLLDVSQRGEWAGWIEFLSRGSWTSVPARAGGSPPCSRSGSTTRNGWTPRGRR